jgi:Protein of unknown function (DUF3499)
MGPCDGGAPPPMLSWPRRRAQRGSSARMRRATSLRAAMAAVPSSIHRARQCSRTSCADLAVATLTYHYQRSTVWIDELTAEREPYGYDLCERHADRVSVPHGWQLDDRRHQLDELDRLAG